MTAPLTPPQCNLKDFPFMPLDVARLRDSDLAALESPEACWTAVLLWCASWHQIPAASLPNDDRILSQLAGFGRVVREWQRVKEGALRGWILCTDGRLYHPIVAEKALEAWASKLDTRWKSECARIKKQNQRTGSDTPYPTFDEFVSAFLSSVPRDIGGLSLGTSGKEGGDKAGPSQGTGGAIGEVSPQCPQGNGIQGTETGTETVNPSSNTVGGTSTVVRDDAGSLPPPPDEPEPPSPSAPTRKGRLCLALRELGFDCPPHLPQWDEILQGWTDEAILAAARGVHERDQGERHHLAYLLPILKEPPKKPREKRPDWKRDDAAAMELAAELGVKTRSGESWSDLRGRIAVALKKREAQEVKS